MGTFAHVIDTGAGDTIMNISCPVCRRTVKASRLALRFGVRCPGCGKFFTIEFPRPVAHPPQAADVSSRPSWYASTGDGRWTGPFSCAQVVQAVNDGAIGPDTILRCAATSVQVVARDVPGLCAARAKAEREGDAARARSADPIPPADREDWFVVTAHGEYGPLETGELVKWARRRLIDAQTRLRHGRNPVCVMASQVPGLLAAIRESGGIRSPRVLN
ncbi:MAG: hypothetical protein BIFFINMI_00788 [Phycisphaerae bacterium]|nr:hypothetical protein [Phycisphaerae bacterium]